MTKELHNALHGHLVISRHGQVSFRANGLL